MSKKTSSKNPSLTYAQAIKTPDKVFDEYDALGDQMYELLLSTTEGREALAKSFAPESEVQANFKKLYDSYVEKETTARPTKAKADSDKLQKIHEKLAEFDDRGEFDDVYFEHALHHFQLSGGDKQLVSELKRLYKRIAVIAKLADFWAAYLVEAEDLDKV